MTPGRRSMFALAERLGMTVFEMQQKMPVAELIMWLKYFNPEKEPATADQILSAFNLK